MLIYTSAVHAGELLTFAAPQGKNQENIYIYMQVLFLKNKINSAAVKMCRLIQLLYSGFVGKVGVQIFYLTYVQNHTSEVRGERMPSNTRIGI